MSAKAVITPLQDLAIRRVLRHRESHAYFKAGGWTSNPEEADSFSDVVEVAEACARYGLNDVELALRYDSARQDLFCTPIR
jgi:hypothetical protein